MLRTIFLVMLSLSAPVAAQQLGPGVVGEGTQTQSLELVDGTVSVTVESSGTVSVGRGEPAVDLNVGVSLGDTTLLGIGSDESVAANQPQTLMPVDVEASTPVVGAQSSMGQDIRLGATSVHTVCEQTAVDEARLAEALSAGWTVWLRPTACAVTSGDLSQTLAGNSEILSRFATLGLTPDNVVSITFHEEAVIVEVSEYR